MLFFLKDVLVLVVINLLDASDTLGGCHALRKLSLDWTPAGEPSGMYLIDTLPGDRLRLLRIMSSRVI